MADMEIPWRDGVFLEDILRRIERWISENGLIHAAPVELRKYPGSLHWHLRRAGISGTLELTVWPGQRRIWMTRRANRDALWIAGLPEEFSEYLSKG